MARHEFSRPAMGIRARIVLYAPNENAARHAAAAAFDRIEQLEQVMSDYRPDSELMRVCDRAGEPAPIPISPDLFAVLCRSVEIARATDGAFDVTIGPVVRLWRQARKAGSLPSADSLAEARSRVGSRHMHLDSQEQSLRLDLPRMRLDLGGIGKGFAAEQAYRVLRDEYGLPGALVDLGGDLRVGTAPPDRPAGWGVAIQTHDPNRTDRIVHLTDCAIATSGDLDQFVEIDGVRYSHIVDPRTGLGLTTRVAVTVIGPDATTADALASAISVLGADKGLEVLSDRFPGYVASVAMLVDATGNVGHQGSGGFPSD
ncbi:MAG: FAD:protein FMN transferase [Planctomycetes bacterium]|nr:FAD:protein FMN transferase [Planctomycetota bacterium]NOG55722.1 FAD:protein FMN transferase [Planctomycetota bacterium]